MSGEVSDLPGQPASSSPSSSPPAPSVARRVPVGVLVAVGLGILYVGIPTAAASVLSPHGIELGFDRTTVFLLGGVAAALAGVRYMLRPTRAFGPAGIAASGAAVLYLLALAREATVTVSVGSHGSVVLGYGLLLELLSIAPAIALAASLVTAIEDWRRPGERVRLDFPAGG